MQVAEAFVGERGENVTQVIQRLRHWLPEWVPLIGREPLITFVTFGELAKWAEIRNWGQRRREELDDTPMPGKPPASFAIRPR